jgi:DNA-binding GntR family transcriptional regulator
MENIANAKLSLNETAYRKISELIISLELAPGSQVDERSLAERLAIGRTPIREALFRLAAEGLVETVPKRGFFIEPVTVEDIRALFEAMILLERDALYLAARRIPEERIHTLKEVNEALRQAMRARDYLKITLENSRFHRFLYEAVGNRFLTAYLNRLQNQAQRLAYLSYSRDMAPDDLESHFQRVIGDHNDIIELLSARDQEGIVRKITQHIQLFRSRVIRYMSPPVGDLDALTPPGDAALEG